MASKEGEHSTDDDRNQLVDDDDEIGELDDLPIISDPSISDLDTEIPSDDDTSEQAIDQDNLIDPLRLIDRLARDDLDYEDVRNNIDDIGNSYEEDEFRYVDDVESTNEENEPSDVDDIESSDELGNSSEDSYESSIEDSTESEDDDLSSEGPSEDEEGIQLPLHPGTTVTRKQLSVMIMALVIVFHLQNDAFQAVLTLISLILPGSVDDTIYKFKKLFKRTKLDYELHFYCQCGAYVGKKGEVMDRRECSNPRCHRLFDVKSAERKLQFFAYYPLRSSIKTLLERRDVGRKLRRKSEWIFGDYSDIFDGEVLKTMIRNGTLQDADLTLSWNVDGARLFQASSDSMTPIQFTINELAPAERRRHVLLAGLWFGGKPVVKTYLQPFVKELLELRDRPIEWQCNGDGRIIRSRIFALVAPVDTIARPTLANITQFNGKMGCHWCLHPGIRVPSGRGHARVYPSLATEPHRRSKDSWEDDALEADQSHLPGRGPAVWVNGVKGKSIVSKIPKFDISWGFPVDYLHQFCHGVVKQLCELWFSSKNYGNPFYIGNRLAEVERRLEKCKGTHEICRSTPKLRRWKSWKANEFKQFSLYYGVLVLQGILPNRFVQHFGLLVHGIRTLLQYQIRSVDVAIAERTLKKFVRDLPVLYRARNVCTANVHQLTHIVECVRKWGPLWSFSCFNFETNNRFIRSFKTGSQHIVKQISSRYAIYLELPFRAEQVCGVADQEVCEYIESLIYFRPRKRERLIEENVFVFTWTGDQVIRETNQEVWNGLPIDITRVLSVKRAQYRGMILDTEQYSASNKRQNNHVVLENGIYYVITKLLVVSSNIRKQLYIAGHNLQPRHREFFADRELNINSKGHFIEVEKQQDLSVYHVGKIEKKCVVVFFDNRTFVSPLIFHDASD